MTWSRLLSSLDFCCCDKYHNQKQLGGKGFISAYRLQSIHCGTKPGQELQGRNLEAETEIETVEEHCLLACSLTHSQPALLQQPRPLPTVGWPLLHGKCPTDIPTSHFVRNNSSLSFPLSLCQKQQQQKYRYGAKLTIKFVLLTNML